MMVAKPGRVDEYWHQLLFEDRLRRGSLGSVAPLAAVDDIHIYLCIINQCSNSLRLLLRS